jgi:SlyX protein
LSSDAARLETLETKAAFQEDALQQLSDVLVAQQARIDRLEARLALLAEQLERQADEGAGLAEERPPHY